MNNFAADEIVLYLHRDDVPEPIKKDARDYWDAYEWENNQYYIITRDDVEEWIEEGQFLNLMKIILDLMDERKVDDVLVFNSFTYES